MAALSHISPSRVEALGDMIFGLALSITAIQLAFAPPNNPVEVVGYIAEFVVSFGLLVWIWTSYTRITERITVEREKLLLLSALLLMLVSLEPYLLFIVWSGVFLGRDQTLLDLSSIAWSLDVALMFLILGLMMRQGILHPAHEVPSALSHEIQNLIHWRYVSAALIALAILPVFWSWTLTTSQLNDASPPKLIVLHARYFYWVVALGAAAIGGRWIARRGERTMQRVGYVRSPAADDA
ncbi:MAG: DUF1211 domain-containing protein [Thermoplasmata archaeon]|nr:DUF1211 domain-containing protein [Thermoplasmata archaeon]